MYSWISEKKIIQVFFHFVQKDIGRIKRESFQDIYIVYGGILK